MLAILQHTPSYVYAVLAVLLLLGVQAMRSRTVSIWRLLLTPALFIGWGLASLALQSAASPLPLLEWLAGAAVGGAIGWSTIRLDDMRIDRARLSVSLPGSALPLIRNLVIFAARYALGVSVALAPAWQAELAVWNIVISGLSAGYFLGWLVRFLSAYRRAYALVVVAPANL
jgi:hypothetical protein